jgi:uncharacterized membrane protein
VFETDVYLAASNLEMLTWPLFGITRLVLADGTGEIKNDDFSQEPTTNSAKLSIGQLATLGVVLGIVVVVVILILIAVVYGVRRSNKQYHRRPHGARQMLDGHMADPEVSEFSEAAAAAMDDAKEPNIS